MTRNDPHPEQLTDMANPIAKATAEVPAHIRHTFERISARASGSLRPAPPGVHRSGSATRKRRPLDALCAPGCRSVADAAACCAPCWPPLAAPGSMRSSCMRRKRPVHVAALLPAHTALGYTSGVRREAA